MDDVGCGTISVPSFLDPMCIVENFWAGLDEGIDCSVVECCLCFAWPGASNHVRVNDKLLLDGHDH